MYISPYGSFKLHQKDGCVCDMPQAAQRLGNVDAAADVQANGRLVESWDDA